MNEEKNQAEENVRDESVQGQVEALERKLAEKEEQAAKWQDRTLRLRADFDNYQKQVGREMESLARRISDQEILDFLPVYDAMERAFRAYRRNEDADSFVEGMERVFAQLAETLRRKGCQPFDSAGKRFDPAYHEVLVAAESDQEHGQILEEFEQGWLREGRVLRLAKVKVSRGPKGGESNASEGKDNRN